MIRMIGAMDEPADGTITGDRFGHMWIRAGDDWVPYNQKDGPERSWNQLNESRGPITSTEYWLG